jgi:hypothetical protein
MQVLITHTYVMAEVQCSNLELLDMPTSVAVTWCTETGLSFQAVIVYHIFVFLSNREIIWAKQ